MDGEHIELVSTFLQRRIPPAAPRDLCYHFLNLHFHLPQIYTHTAISKIYLIFINFINSTPQTKIYNLPTLTRESYVHRKRYLRNKKYLFDGECYNFIYTYIEYNIEYIYMYI